MTGTIRVALESGNKGKKSSAYAIDWPGWNRGGKSDGEAYSNWSGYRDRSRSIAERTGLLDEFEGQVGSEVMVTCEGTGSRNFWAISLPASNEQPAGHGSGRNSARFAKSNQFGDRGEGFKSWG
jgi:hypothetical protein